MPRKAPNKETRGAPIKDVKQEFLKCAKDPIYFITNYLYIQVPTQDPSKSGIEKFKLWDFQKDIIKNMYDGKDLIILKSRQLGISTVMSAYAFWELLFKQNRVIAVLATKRDVAQNIMQKVNTFWENLPSNFLKPEKKADNQTLLELENGSRLIISATGDEPLRGYALTRLILDEAAFIGNMEEIWAAVRPALSVGGRCTMLSSPNGVGNFFHKYFLAAKEKKNNYIPVTLMWDVRPDRDENFLDNELKEMNGDTRKLAQEYMCSFEGSSETVIGMNVIEYLLENIKEPLDKTEGNSLWIWEEPIKGDQYVLSGDVARGNGADYSTFHVINLRTMEQVAEYKAKIFPDMFALKVVQYATYYNNALVIIENNSYGFSVLQDVIKTGYDNVYFQKSGIEREVGKDNIDQYYAIGGYEYMTYGSMIPGVITSTSTKLLMVNKMEEFVRNNVVKINSERLIDEFKVFIHHNGRPEALRGYNDDLTMAFTIMCWVVDIAKLKNVENIGGIPDILPIYVRKNNFDTSYGMEKKSPYSGIDPSVLWILMK